jgi:hypothetical protein
LAAAGGYLRRARRASFARWRASAQPDARRRRAAVLDAELARNESRALFSAVREARRKETLRVFCSQWQRYVARRGVGRAAVALADRVLRRRRETCFFREWRDLTVTAIDEACANVTLAEKHDRARKRRVRSVDAFRDPRRVARRRLGVKRGSRRRSSRGGVFPNRFAKNVPDPLPRLGVGGARVALQGVRSRATSRRAERAEMFGVRIVLRRKREAFAAYRRITKNAIRTRTRVGLLVAKRVRNATYPAFKAWADFRSGVAQTQGFRYAKFKTRGEKNHKECVL